jgi:crotonobetainyl-CoA:carnitine CoA-transferase CaiB-like acyl-CoA transferase
VRIRRIAALAAEWATPFEAADWPLLDRDLSVAAQRRPGCSVNGNSRLVRTSDGWMAVTLARDEDRTSVAAWLEGDADEEPWTEVERRLPERDCATLIERAELLGLPVARLREVAAGDEAVPVLHRRGGVARRQRMRVVDMSALWAGPLCAGLLGAWGAEVVRVESLTRPDPTPVTSPLLDARINGGKRRVALDLAGEAGQATLRELIAEADVLVTSARARGLAGLDLVPKAVFAANPALIWVAVTGHGWASARVGFGDDAAVAGGLVSDGPDFLGDALADPLTGLSAARAALAMLEAGEAGLVDVALARCAAHVAGLVA